MRSSGADAYDNDHVPEKNAFYYMAAVEVADLNHIPDGLTGKTIPALDFAVFNVKSNNQNGEFGKAFRYIYDEWLPNCEYEFSPDLCADFEYYDERWRGGSEEAEIDIYIPIRKG